MQSSNDSTLTAPLTVLSQDVVDPTNTIKIGTRKSRLALIQANEVASQLAAAHPGLRSSLSTIMVRGDADKISPLVLIADKVGGTNAAKNLWTEEMEIKLCAGELDLLVHSLKDMPTVLPEGCILGAVLQRGDPSDALVVKNGLPYKHLDDLPDGAVVGTSSTRRKAMLKRLYPRLVVRTWRGNVDTRVKKLDIDEDGFSAIIVATAGLVRLGLSDRITTRLSPLMFPYAVGQGALGVEIRANDTRILEILKIIEEKTSRWMCLAERAMLRTLQGGCSSPIGVVCSSYQDEVSAGQSTFRKARMLRLTGLVVHPHGWSDFSTSLSTEVASDDDAEALGVKVAETLLIGGAGELLAEIKVLRDSGFGNHLEKPFDKSQSENDFRQESARSKPSSVSSGI